MAPRMLFSNLADIHAACLRMINSGSPFMLAVPPSELYNDSLPEKKDVNAEAFVTCDVPCSLLHISSASWRYPARGLRRATEALPVSEANCRLAEGGRLGAEGYLGTYGLQLIHDETQAPRPPAAARPRLP